MKALKTFIPAAALAASLVAFAAPVQAAVFAAFTPDKSAMDYRWINNGASNTGTGGHFFSITPTTQNATTAQGVNTHFQFLNSLSSLGFIPSTFTLDATAVAAPASTNVAGVVSQTNVNGNFSFVYSGATTTNFNGSGITLTHGENLLSGVFTDAWIQGAGGSGSFNLAHINGGVATYSSALMSFSNADPATEEFAFNLLAAKPNFGHKPGAAMSSFRANGGGNFSANFVPEPATWALMLVGFGGLGAMMRRRRQAFATA